MGVPSPAAELMALQSTIDEVTGFAHDLSLRHIRDDEMPSQVINVSRVNFFVGCILGGGFQQFVHNSNWDRSFVAGVRSGLAAIGAREHLAVFEGASGLVDAAYASDGELDTDNFEATLTRLESKYLSNLRLTLRTGLLVSKRWTWGERWQSAQILNARYIGRWRKVRRLPQSDYEAALDRIAERIPDLAIRRQKSEGTRAWEKNAIDLMVAQAFFSDIWYTAFGTREHNGKKVWCWNFTVGKTPGQGHHQAIFVDGQAIMFKGDTDQIVAQRSAPEAFPGSGVTSNEPELEPGTQNPNLVLTITNP